MDPQLIKSLIDALAASDLSELEFSKDGETLRLVKSVSRGATPRASAPATVAPAPTALAPEPPASPDFCSPLYGVVHLAPNPEAPPFVQPGQAVQAGQTLCVIEAMKAFTELRADASGTIAAVLVTSGQDVEAGQPLFRFA